MAREKNDMRQKAGQRRRRAVCGMTLVEVLVTLMVYFVVFTAAYMGLSSGVMSWQANSAKMELQQELRKSMSWLSQDLRQAKAADLPVPGAGWSTSVTFSVANGVSGGSTVLWSTDKIHYYLGGTGNHTLKRDYGADARDIAHGITVFNIRRPVATPDIVEVKLESEKVMTTGQTVHLDLAFSVRLRN